MRTLSDRQMKILVLSAEGRTTKAISEELRFDSATIKRDIGGMLKEFGVPNRVALVAQAIREGVID